MSSSLATEFKKATAASGPAGHRQIFRTVENDPTRHVARHEGFFYTVPHEDRNRWMSKGLRIEFNKVMNAFNETCLMIRSPALEVIAGLNSADYSMTANRYILYGRTGCGKSVSLAHIMHHAGRRGWFVAHMPWAPLYNRYYKDYALSSFKPGRVDQPIDCADWLGYFRRMNQPLLTPESQSSGDSVVRTVGRYVWNRREATEIGTPLTELIDYGITRAKHSSDVVGALMKELQMQASAGTLKILVAVDGINAFWGQTTIKQEEQRHLRYSSMDLSMTQHFMRFFRDDWNGGACVGTLDSIAAYPISNDRYTPIDLLGHDGFQQLDPFLPIHVPIYNEREAFSCIEYFRDRRWIHSERGSTEEGRRELLAISGNHPWQLYLSAVHW